MINISTPDKCLEILQKRISKQEWAAFFGALVMGLMTHIYAFVNKLYNYDELPNTPGGFIGAGNNRWFLELMGKGASHFLGGSYSLPFINGIVSLLLLSISALLIVRMFEVKSRLLSCFIGGFLVVFPAVTCLFYFMFLASYYSVGIFLSILAAYLVVKHPKNLVCNGAAVLFLACSVGTYQAYFPNTVCLFMISIILLCAFGEYKQTWKDIIFLALRYVIILALGMLLYFILNKMLLRYWNISLALGGYQGLDSMGQVTGKEIIDAVKRCYQSFFALERGNVMNLNNKGLVRKGFGLSIFLLGVSAVSLLYFKKGEWVKKVFLFIGFLLFPVALFLTYIMAPRAGFYALMGYSVVFLFVFLAIWTDYYYNYVEKGALFGQGLQWLTAGISVVLLAVYIWYGNGSYMSLEYTKLHDLAYFETMVTQIKSAEGYRDEMPLVLIGNDIEDQTNGAGSLVGDVFPLDGRSESNVNRTSGIYLIAKYLGFTPEFCSYEETLEWMEREELEEMSCYPDDGSIQVIDGTIVVKLSETDN